MNDKQTENLPATQGAANILNEAQADAGFEKLLKFNKGEYEAAGENVPLGTRVTAHCIGWTKAWIKFKDKKFADRKIFRVAKGDRVLDRDQLDDRDEKLWPIGLNGQPNDPWVFQFLLPMENCETGDLMIFVTSSFGGKRAVADLCNAYGRRAVRDARAGQPVVRLQKTMMQTQNFGKVPRPHFEIVSWNDDSVSVREVPELAAGGGGVAAEMEDEIPFDVGVTMH